MTINEVLVRIINPNYYFSINYDQTSINEPETQVSNSNTNKNTDPNNGTVNYSISANKSNMMRSTELKLTCDEYKLI